MKKIVVLDLEFCQIAKKNKSRFTNLYNEIIEIGAVMLDERMNVIDCYQQYVKPQYGVVSERITKLTGISNDMLEDKKDFESCLEEFLNWMGSDTQDVEICSWSLSDLSQMRSETYEKGIKRPEVNRLFEHWRDTQEEFSRGLCFQGIVSLSTAMSAIDMDFSGKVHSALADAYNTAELVKLMADAELFKRRTRAIRSLFEAKEDEGNTLGAMFTDVFNSVPVYA